ncbi:MAG: hypothetical protein JSW11_02020, partial [Candidatus Heimdallarchaeota archaeon]
MNKLTNPKPVESSPTEEINWENRISEKHRLFIKHVKILGILVLLSLVGIIIPLWIISPTVGKSLFISLPPMLFLTLSWMFPSWLFLYNKAMLLPTTLGTIPLRIILVVIFSYIIWVYIPNVLFMVFIFGMMW